MDKKSVLFGILATVLLGGSFGIIPINNSFADDDNLSVSREDSDSHKKQLEKAEEKKKAEERKDKLDEKKKEREKKAEERKLKAEEKRKELERKKLKLENDRKKFEEKLSKKLNKYEEKLKEIKEKYQNKIESESLDDEQFSSTTEKLEDKIAKLEDKIAKKSEKIRENLEKKLAKLDTRTQKILGKINDGKYLGDKIGSSTTSEAYELVFDSVEATAINDNTQKSSLTGFMSFTTFDKGKFNLKLELEECQITVDNVPYNCGFGKARTSSSGDSGTKDSLVILAFLEDDVLEEVHSTLKIFLNADSPIRDIDGSSQVSILGPQSKIAGMWFLDGTGTLTKTISEDTTDDTTDNSTGKEFSVELTESIALKGN
ncbi:MAG: hypothetical protein ACE5GR_08525 [Nitrosopumilus sp.]